MARLPVLTYPDSRLKETCAPVEYFDELLRTFVADLEETMRASPGGVGLAAPQVGMLRRIVIVDISAKRHMENHGRLVLVNPEILTWDGMAKGREGCLSVPDYTANVIRAQRITVTARDEYGTEHEYQFKDYEARAVQHEMDHLDGTLFLDRVVSRRNDLFRRE